MSSRTTASDPAATLRAATREAHETLKDLRAAIREARQLKAGTPAFVAGVIEAAVAEIGAGIEASGNEVIEHLQANVDKVLNHQASLLGAQDLNQFMKAMIDGVTASLIEQQDQWVTRYNARAVRG